MNETAAQHERRLNQRGRRRQRLAREEYERDQRVERDRRRGWAELTDRPAYIAGDRGRRDESNGGMRRQCADEAGRGHAQRRDEDRKQARSIDALQRRESGDERADCRGHAERRLSEHRRDHERNRDADRAAQREARLERRTIEGADGRRELAQPRQNGAQYCMSLGGA